VKPVVSTKLMPTIGDMRQRLALEAPVRTPDGSGGATRTFSAVADVWADVRTLGGHENLDSDRLGSRITHTVWIRYRDGLKPDQRFRLGARIFEIRSVIDHDGRRRFLECHCEEIVT
jgi:SPP1 family predicted phage head-tail adaptor